MNFWSLVYIVRFCIRRIKSVCALGTSFFMPLQTLHCIQFLKTCNSGIPLKTPNREGLSSARSSDGASFPRPEACESQRETFETTACSVPELSQYLPQWQDCHGDWIDEMTQVFCLFTIPVTLSRCGFGAVAYMPIIRFCPLFVSFRIQFDSTCLSHTVLHLTFSQLLLCFFYLPSYSQKEAYLFHIHFVRYFINHLLGSLG